jgi:tetratricopeptide (TPR) repeat protein
MNRKQRRAEERKLMRLKAGGRAGLERDFASALADHKKGLLIEAKKGYRKVLAVDGSHPFALNNLSVIANQISDHSAALDYAERTLDLKPDYAEAHCNKANALAELGLLEDAVAGYGQALDLKPGYAEAHNNKGNTLRKLERLEEAAEDFARALAINQDFYQARANLADLKLQQGEPAAALELCESALARKPGDTAVLALKGVVLWDLVYADEARALVDFDRLIRHDLIAPQTCP